MNQLIFVFSLYFVCNINLQELQLHFTIGQSNVMGGNLVAKPVRIVEFEG
jgi:hypothetical protein